MTALSLNKCFFSGLIFILMVSCVQTKKEHYSNGQIKSKIQYKKGVKHGYANYYYNNGSMHIKCNYINDRLNGEYKSWYFSGNLEREEYYINDTLHGMSKKYWDSGKLKMLVEYSMGELNGNYIEYHENGQVKVEGMFIMDEFEGDWSYFDPSGILIGKGFYEAGTGINVSFYYNTSDTLVKTPYLSSEKHGNEVWYNRDGTVAKIIIWDKGEFKSQKIYNNESD